MNERSTKFAGFAKLLQDDLAHSGYDEIGYRSGETTKRIIAERAYDLVRHAISSIGPYHLDVLTTEETIEDIPDLTAWTEPPAI